VQWTPRLYSHLRYTHLAKRTIAQSTNLTVFVRLQGSISEWHLYGVDDCAFTHEENRPRLAVSNALTNNRIPVTLIAPVSKTFRIEGSTNLQTWSPLASFPSGNGYIQFSIPQVSNYHHRYFRARQLP
jgi:hypothetical protein